MQAAIQVTFLIAMPVETFFGATLVENLALLLSIPSSRIKVVDVRAGSTAVDVSIADQNATVLSSDSGSTANISAAQDEQTMRLLNLTLLLQSYATSGELSTKLGLPILSMTIQPLPYNLTTTGTPPVGAPAGVTAEVISTSSSGSSGTLSRGAIIGIAVGCTVAFIAVAVLVFLLTRAPTPKVLTMGPAGPGISRGDSVKSWFEFLEMLVCVCFTSFLVSISQCTRTCITRAVRWLALLVLPRPRHRGPTSVLRQCITWRHRIFLCINLVNALFLSVSFFAAPVFEGIFVPVKRRCEDTLGVLHSCRMYPNSNLKKRVCM